MRLARQAQADRVPTADKVIAKGNILGIDAPHLHLPQPVNLCRCAVEKRLPRNVQSMGSRSEHGLAECPGG